jgi:hypothetical protein
MPDDQLIGRYADKGEPLGRRGGVAASATAKVCRQASPTLAKIRKAPVPDT